MSVKYYPAVIERGHEGFGVFFPDLDGCVSAGDTLQQAAQNAEEALSGHILVMASNLETLPDPSALDDLKLDDDIDIAAIILVRAETGEKKMRINITMDESLIAAIDATSKNRSAFLSEAARRILTT